jgi:cell fate regulator YaaT (PSP1 superfamily)
MSVTLLVRYGRIPEVARVQAEARRERGDRVVVRTRRGTELATVLETLRNPPKPEAGEEGEASDFTVLRDATSEDQFEFTGLSTRAAAEFPDWVGRAREWNLDLQIVDLEWTLDRQKLIVYVLNDRGPESTKLAIQAAAAGLGLIEVQPVSKDGLVELPSEGGCGTGSCGCSH